MGGVDFILILLEVEDHFFNQIKSLAFGCGVD